MSLKSCGRPGCGVCGEKPEPQPKPMTLTLTLSEGEASVVRVLLADHQVDLMTLLRDALGEFQDTRTPTVDYLVKRYSYDMGNPSPDVLRRVKEVQTRKKIARMICRADLKVES